QQNHTKRLRRMGSGTRTLFSQQVGSRLDTDPVVQRSEGKTTRWRFAGCEIRQRFLRLYQLFLVSAVAGRSPGSLSLIREHVVAGKMSGRGDNTGARSWRKAYSVALSIFAVEVMLLYLFTLRFS